MNVNPEADHIHFSYRTQNFMQEVHKKWLNS